MDHRLRQRVSAAAHAELVFANPLSEAAHARLVDRVVQRAPRTILDIGCGSAGMCLSLARDLEADIVGLDVNADLLARARQSLATESLRGRVRLLEQDAASGPRGPFDAVLCLGASQAFGTPREAIVQCAERLTPQGVLVMAELVWTAAPPEAFLDLLGTPASMFWHREEADAVVAEAGLGVIHAERTSVDDFDAYEQAVLRGRLTFAGTQPPGIAAQVSAQALGWFEAWQAHGRGCLGFDAWVACVA